MNLPEIIFQNFTDIPYYLKLNINKLQLQFSENQQISEYSPTELLSDNGFCQIIFKTYTKANFYQNKMKFKKFEW